MRWKLAAAAFCFLAGVVSTPAQALGVRVRVPFAFEVANKKVPAGEYVLFTDHNEVYLRESEGNYVAIVSSNRVVRSGGNPGQVIFRCYENQCFLSELWLPDAEQGRMLVESKSEKEAARKTSAQQFALLGESAQTSGRQRGQR
jgi:hypothetical protein